MKKTTFYVLLSLVALSYASDLPSLKKFDASIMGSFTATGSIRTIVDIPMFNISIPNPNSVPCTFHFDFEHSLGYTFDGQGIFWYFPNGSYIQYLFAGDNETCWYDPRPFSEQIENYAGLRYTGSVADPLVGLVDQYKGMIRDNGYCEIFYYSEIDVKKDGDQYNWVTWLTQSPFKIDGTPFGMKGQRIPVRATAVYEFTSWKHGVPDPSVFALPKVCWNPQTTGYCERYFPTMKECSGF